MVVVIVERSVSDVIDESNRYSLDHCFSFFVVQNTEHTSLLSWTVGILLEKATNTSSALIDAATRFHVSLHLLLFVLYGRSFPNHYFVFALD